jgi:hypothetical protein
MAGRRSPAVAWPPLTHLLGTAWAPYTSTGFDPAPIAATSRLGVARAGPGTGVKLRSHCASACWDVPLACRTADRPYWSRRFGLAPCASSKRHTSDRDANGANCTATWSAVWSKWLVPFTSTEPPCGPSKISCTCGWVGANKRVPAKSKRKAFHLYVNKIYA